MYPYKIDYARKRNVKTARWLSVVNGQCTDFSTMSCQVQTIHRFNPILRQWQVFPPIHSLKEHEGPHSLLHLELQLISRLQNEPPETTMVREHTWPMAQLSIRRNGKILWQVTDITPVIRVDFLGQTSVRLEFGSELWVLCLKDVGSVWKWCRVVTRICEMGDTNNVMANDLKPLWSSRDDSCVYDGTLLGLSNSVPIYLGISCHDTTLYGDITYNEPDRNVLRTYIPLLLTELRRYASLLSSVCCVVLTQNLHFNATKWNGIPLYEKRALYLDISPSPNQSADVEFLRRVIHHEIFHLLVYSHIGKDMDQWQDICQRWEECNLPEFRYDDEVSSSDMNKVPTTSKSIVEQGFVSTYAKSSVEEDMAEMYGFWQVFGQERLLAFVVQGKDGSEEMGADVMAIARKLTILQVLVGSSTSQDTTEV